MLPNRTKGKALNHVREQLEQFVVPDLMLLSCDVWEKNSEELLDAIQQRFGTMKLAVRSSASDEDGESRTRAGEYDSVLNVPAADRGALRSAISTVVASYALRSRGGAGEEVMVQEMVCDVVLSGVVFTHEMNSGAPYYVVNYDDVSGLTNTVTSGAGEYANRTLYIHRGSAAELRSERLQRLITAVAELEEVTGSVFLDIEFALDATLQPYLIQFRAITTRPNWNRGLARRIEAELSGIQTFVRNRFRPLQGVFGTTTVLGQMPDWNPAEMIGRAPRALSLSLYRRLITDDAWRVARETMGYAVPAGQQLMVSLAGQPFVDTRLSFHSYLPATLSPAIAGKLVDTWVERLREHPELHDKIEFEVAITAFTFDLEERMDTLATPLDASQRGLFREALLGLTLPLLQGVGEGSIAAALDRVEHLAALQLPEPGSGTAGLMRLIEECIRYGTVPFAILARHGFIARSLLLSLVHRGVLDDETVTRLQGGVRTVAGELLEHMHALQRGELSRTDFMLRYGHLRPGTYDILSPRYDQMEAFGPFSMAPQVHCGKAEPFQLPTQQRRAVDALLQETSMQGIDNDGLLAYIAAAIAGREYGKFVFTRSVSAMLELIATFGESHGMSREEMSHVPLEALQEIDVKSGGGRSVEQRLRETAEANTERHALTSAIRLPQILFDEAGVHVVPFQVTQPNFITTRTVSADAVYLGLHQRAPELAGRIVLIDNADPGYDWIFAQSIAGLVTKYGGANSHMAIRCAEFGIPAAIGCGEQRFDTLLKASRMSLNCAVGLIDILH